MTTRRKPARRKSAGLSKKRGPKPWVPTEKDRDFIIAMVANGATHAEIGSVLKVSDDTLQRRCAFELHQGLARAHADVARSLYMRAVGGPSRDWRLADTTAAIFYAKTRMKWAEPAKESEIVDLRVESLSDRQLDILLERIVARRRRTIAYDVEPDAEAAQTPPRLQS